MKGGRDNGGMEDKGMDGRNENKRTDMDKRHSF